MALKRFLAALLLAALWVSLSPAPAEAQRRSARAARPSGAIVAVYPPFYYDPWRPYPFDWYGPFPYAQRYHDNSASLQLQVVPKTAEVYVDGYYAGTVDQFDGAFQRLRVEPGQHEITVYAEGYRAFRQRLYLQPFSTLRVKQTLERLPSGEAQEARPSPPPPPPTAAGSAPAPGPRRPQRPVVPRPRARIEPQERREPPPAPPSTREATSSGVLSIRVQPGNAEIWIDGERWEGTDGDSRLLVQLAQGQHRLEVRGNGFQTFSRTIEIKAGETETVNVSLTRE